MKRLVAFLTAALMFVGVVSAQKKIETATIKTSIQCSQCEARILKNIPYEKGIKDVKVDIDKKNVWVQYDATKTDIGKIRAAIAMLGYNADDVKRDPKAYNKLPMCCREDSGMGRH